MIAINSPSTAHMLASVIALALLLFTPGTLPDSISMDVWASEPSGGSQSLEQYRGALEMITRGDRERAQPMLEQAVRLSPAWPLPRLELAVNIIELGQQPQNAFEHLEVFMSIDRQNPRAWY
ncbi:MAG: hypothetical protein WC889_19810, partial [Myxococcota bacterium]